MSKKHNGFDWERYNEQKQKELQAEDASKGLLDPPSSEEEQDSESEEGKTDGQDDGGIGSDNPQQHRDPFPGAIIGLSTPVGRMVHDKDVRDRIGSFVDYFLTHAAKGKYPVPAGMPDHGHEQMVFDGKVLVWLIPGAEYTLVHFAFGTSDDIMCQARAIMENTDLEEIKEQMEIYITNQRRENLQPGHARIVH